MTIAASDAAGLEAHSTVVQSAIVSNTAQGLAQFVSELLPNDNDYTTRRARAARPAATRVRIGPTTARSASSATSTSTRARAGDARPRRRGLHEHRALDRPDRRSRTLADFYPNIGNLTKSSARAIGILVVMNDLRAASEAYLDNAIVDAGGNVTVSAEETAQLLSEATSTVTASGGSFYGGGTVQAINGQVVTNVVLASATASITDSDVTADGDVTVAAANHAGIDATLLVATNSGDTAVSISLAFNSLGWKSQNILFNLVDAVLGSPIVSGALDGEDPVARLGDDQELDDHAGGNLTVTADGAALLNATVSNAADSAAAALFNATGKAIGLAVAQNKVSSEALASIDGLRRRRPTAT